MPYSHRLATTADATAIAPLWAAFAEERASVDPSMAIKPNFDFEKYVTYQLEKPLSFCWVLEHYTEEEPKLKTIVGCIFIYFYDEAPPDNIPPEMIAEHEIENPFVPRRVGSVLGMYVRPEHRKPEAIKLIADASISKAEEMQISDIDLLIGADQTGMQALLQRAGFTKTAVQYTRHYQIETTPDLPNLHPPHPDLDLPDIPSPGAIPLRDPKTSELVRNLQEEPIFISPLIDDKGELIKSSAGLPIYPPPLRDPQTQDWVFDAKGELVVCPVLLDDDRRVFEYNGIPQFHPIAYKNVSGKLYLKQDDRGNFVFCEVERNKKGEILLSPSGQPVFKQPLQSGPGD